MKFNELNVIKTKRPVRVGRGIASGKGKTAGRGTKGQKSRTGYRKRPGFEGGQNPIMQRLPKLHGFRSLKSKDEIIYTYQLEKFAGKTVTVDDLLKAGLIKSVNSTVKVLVKGELTKKVIVKLPSASAAAIEVIEKSGGNFEKVARRALVKKDDKLKDEAK